MELAHAAFEAGRYHDSLTRFSKLLERLPDNAAVLCARSAALKKLGRWPEAIIDAEHALQVSPRGHAQIEPLYRLACALRSSGNAGRAKEVVVLALALQPEDAPKRALSELFQQCESTLRDQMPNVAIHNSRVQVRCPRRTRKRISPRGSLEGGRSQTSAAYDAANDVTDEPGHELATSPTAPHYLGHDPTVWARPLLRASAWFFLLLGWLLHNVFGLEMLPLELGELSKAVDPATMEGTGDEKKKGAPLANDEPHATSEAERQAEEATTTSLSVLPSDLLGSCLAPLTLLDLLSSRCVSRSWSEQSTLHLGTRSKLPEGTYLFAATCVATGGGGSSSGGEMHVEPTATRLQSAGCLTFCADGLDGDWSSVRGSLVSEEEDATSTNTSSASPHASPGAIPGAMAGTTTDDRHEVFGRWLPDGSVDLWWVRASAVDGRPERISHGMLP